MYNMYSLVFLYCNVLIYSSYGISYPIKSSRHWLPSDSAIRSNLLCQAGSESPFCVILSVISKVDNETSFYESIFACSFFVCTLCRRHSTRFILLWVGYPINEILLS